MIYVDKWISVSMEQMGWGKSHLINYQIREDNDWPTSIPDNRITYKLKIIHGELVISDFIYKALWEQYRWGEKPYEKDIFNILNVLINNQSRFLSYDYEDLKELFKYGYLHMDELKSILPYMEEPQWRKEHGRTT